MCENVNLFTKFDKFKSVYLMEKHRIDSYKNWPFDESSPCSIEKMAEAGFFWSGNDKENDIATCFVCHKNLHGWEPTDDPWKEHAKHAPQCLFIKYGRKEKDLLLEEFFIIFGEVVKSSLKRNLQRIKDKYVTRASADLETFRKQK
uniref:Uncharacterized protein n=1 Tax=Glossina brevipalpis TaxID=37001 RepID=A0A1A9WNN5_9MUSC